MFLLNEVADYLVVEELHRLPLGKNVMEQIVNGTQFNANQCKHNIVFVSG